MLTRPEQSSWLLRALRALIAILAVAFVLSFWYASIMQARAEAVDECLELAPSPRVGNLYCPGNPWELIELWQD